VGVGVVSDDEIDDDPDLDVLTSGITFDDLLIEEFQDQNRWTWYQWRCPCGCYRITVPFDRASVEHQARWTIRRHMDRDERLKQSAPFLSRYNSIPNCRAWLDGDGIRVEYTAPPRRPSRVAAWVRRLWSSN
jgi:hypothetical protein